MANNSNTNSVLPENDSKRTPFIDKQTVAAAYDESNKWFRPYFEPIDEFERIARNKPSDRIPQNLPRITDGTAAAMVQEDPKRIIQQLATGIVECHDYPEFAKMADIAHRYVIQPNYHHMGTALQKHWNMLGKAKTWGRSTSYTFFTNTNGVFHTDYVIPYVKDVITEKGKVYAPDSNIEFMRSWYQARDIKAIINGEKRRKEADKNYKSEWNLELLAEMLNFGGSAKPADLQTPAEREKGGDAGGFEVIHAFQRGKGAEFYSFAPRFKDGECLRVKVNADPRGKSPLDHEYYNIDLSNPLGRGAVELMGGIQNIMDQKLQMHQFLMTILMGPPLQVFGSVNKGTLKFKPNAIWDMGTNPNNLVKPYEVNNAAVQNFVGDMQFLQSKLMNLNSSQDTSVGAENGNAGQSKTQAGVKSQEARLGVSDSYARKQHEAWVNDQTETSINIFFAEMKGEGRIKLKKEDLKDFQKNPDMQVYLDPQTGELKVPYKKISDATFKFTVDASSSEIKEDADNADKLAQALQLVQTSQNPQIQAAEVKVTKLLLDEIGAEGTDDLFPDEELDENGQPVQTQANNPQMMMQQLMPQIQQMVQEMLQQEKANKPQADPTLELIKALGLKYDQLPEEARRIVLEHTGFGTDGADPVKQKQIMEQLKDLTQIDAHEREPEEKQNERDFQSKQAEQQAQVSQNNSAQQGSNGSNQQPQQQDQFYEPDETEQQVVEALLSQGFSEDDVEQGIILMRQGMPFEQVQQVLGAKYAQQ